MKIEDITSINMEGLIEELSDEELTACVGGTGYVKTKNGKPVDIEGKSDEWIQRKLEKGKIEYDPDGSARSRGWSGVWSDRNMKENFAPVDAQDVLAKVANLPIETWNYKEESPENRHIGPMAQDFAAAFEVGESERLINLIDANGVALAAIQALHQQLQEKDAQIEAMRADLETLKQQMLESRIQSALAMPVAVLSCN